MESNTHFFFECSKSFFFLHVAILLMPFKLLESMVLWPCQDTIYNWRHFYPEKPFDFQNVCLRRWKQKGMWYIILKGKRQKKHSSLSSGKLIQIREWPEITGWCFFPQTSGDPRNHTENRCLFGRPDVITYSSMINGYAKVSWVWIGGLQRFGIGKNLPCIHVVDGMIFFSERISLNKGRVQNVDHHGNSFVLVSKNLKHFHADCWKDVFFDQHIFPSGWTPPKLSFLMSTRQIFRSHHDHHPSSWKNFCCGHTWIGISTACIVDQLQQPYRLPPTKTNVTGWKIHHEWNMYFQLNMGIFQCHVSFQRCLFCEVREKSHTKN